MPAPLSGIGQQVADNLFELGKSTVKSAADAGKKIAETTIEQITGAPSAVGAQQADKPKEPNKAQEQSVEEKRHKEKQRYEQVKAELEQYRQRKQQLDQQIANEKAQEDRVKQQKDAEVKQKKESFVQQLLHKVSGGSHGETDRQKE